MPYLRTYDVTTIHPAKCTPLTPESFAPYGSIISAPHQLQTQKSISANYGTAIKLHKVSQIQDLSEQRSKPATLNWNIFRCSPPTHLMTSTDDGSALYTAKVLERHPFSSQTFAPMGADKNQWSYVVVCALMDDEKMPIPDTVQAFICKGDQAVTYAAGTWHAPMISLVQSLDFAVLIHENGIPEEDCEECLFEPGFQVVIPKEAVSTKPFSSKL